MKPHPRVPRGDPNAAGRWPLLGCALTLALASAACGDPIVVLGDAPGFMRVAVGIPDSIGRRVDSLALRTRLTDPSAVAFDEERLLLYAIDRGALRQQGGVTTAVARIMAVDSRSRLRLVVDAGGCTTGTCLYTAAQLTPAPDGTFLIADPLGHRIMRFDPASAALGVVAGTGTDAFTPDGAPAAGAALRSPSGVAVGADGTIYIGEAGAHRVRFIDAAGNLQTLAGTGSSGYTGDGGPAAAAALALPGSLAAGDDVLYIADAGSHTVRRVDLQSGLIESVAGGGGPGYSGDGGAAALAQLYAPSGLVLSPDGGALFIADRENHRVRVVQLGSGTIRTFAGTGSTRLTGTRGPAGLTSLNRPTGLAVNSLGFLYIADTGHHVVWRVPLTF